MDVKQEISFAHGTYVAAVSGGIDSVVLLDMLARSQAVRSGTVKLIVAHYDHGIRPDSHEDYLFVKKLAALYRFDFWSEQGNLGKDASEAAARQARYGFLHRVRKQTGADAIITAHQQDDVIETMIINMLRGTGGRGLHSLASTATVLRPILGWSKQQIREYAHLHNLKWHEDSTNTDTRYLRNYIRASIMPRLDEKARRQLLAYSKRAAELTAQIDRITVQYLAAQPTPYVLERYGFIRLPHVAAREVVAAWLRCYTPVVVNRRMLERLVCAIKTGRSGAAYRVARGYTLTLSKDFAELQR